MVYCYNILKIKEIKIRIKLNKFEIKIIPLLVDEIFHITSYKNYKNILQHGYIENNLSLGNTPTTSHSRGSYFYKRGFISLFDGRRHKRTTWRTLYEQLWKYLPYAKLDNKYVILFLGKDRYKEVKEINYKRVKGEMIIPYIEIGYKDKISIDKIYKVFIITNIEEKPKIGSFLYIHKLSEKLEKKT